VPIFEYECTNCGATEEHLITGSKSYIPDRCELCGGKLKKIMSKGSFQLLGSGWYKTDYANKGNKKDGQKTNTNKL